MSSQIRKNGIKITEVRISNFRSLRNICLRLNNFNLLIGENNAGKTSFLEAIYAAIGIGRRVISVDDVFLAPGESSVPKERMITIDLLIRPIDSDNQIIDAFPEGDYWLNLFGNAVQQDEDDNDFIGIRTQFKWDTTKGEYISQRKYLAELKEEKDWLNAKTKDSPSVSRKHIEPMALYYIDTKRDMEDELKNKGSFWHKLISEPGLSEEETESFEKTLTSLNSDIVNKSTMLSYVQSNLNQFHKIISCDKDSIAITPLVRHLRDMNKGMNVTFSTKGAQSFPLSQHGMGTRSLASLLIFRAYTNWRQTSSQKEQVHSMLALEEPEVNLHPQAQRAIFNEIRNIPGQIFVSTHSPYIISQANISDYYHFYKLDGETRIVQFDSFETLDQKDKHNINRMVLNTRGDVLFARAVIFFEGETEEQAFPIFAEKYWSVHPNSLGISLISVRGSNYLPYIILMHNLQIPWYIFADGEPKPLSELKKALYKIGIKDYEQDPSKYSNVEVIENGGNFESYIVDEYQDLIFEILNNYNQDEKFIETYMKTHQGDKRKGGTIRNYTGQDGIKMALKDILSEGKTKYASFIADAIVNNTHDNYKDIKIPPKIKTLFNQVSKDLNINLKEGEKVE